MLCYCNGVLCNSAMRSYCCCFCAIACLCSCVIATAILWRRFVRQDLYLNTLVVFTMALSDTITKAIWFMQDICMVDHVFQYNTFQQTSLYEKQGFPLWRVGVWEQMWFEVNVEIRTLHIWPKTNNEKIWGRIKPPVK